VDPAPSGWTIVRRNFSNPIHELQSPAGFVAQRTSDGELYHIEFGFEASPGITVKITELSGERCGDISLCRL
jgi:hypothetical protein